MISVSRGFDASTIFPSLSTYRIVGTLETGFKDANEVLG